MLYLCLSPNRSFRAAGNTFLRTSIDQSNWVVSRQLVLVVIDSWFNVEGKGGRWRWLERELVHQSSVAQAKGCTRS